MDVDHFSEYFNKAAVLYVEGRQHHVNVRWLSSRGINCAFCAKLLLPRMLCFFCISLSVCLPVHLSVRVYVFLADWLSICLSVCLSVHLFVCVYVFLADWLSIRLSICLSVCLPLSLCVCL